MAILSRQMVSNLLSAPVMIVFIVPLFSFYAPTGPGDISPLASTLIGIAFLSVLPSIPILLMARREGLDFEVPEKSRRSIFFLLAILSYAAGALIYHTTDSRAMFALCIAYVIATSTITVINRFWKISVHTTGSAGLVTAMVWVLGPWMLPLFLLTMATIMVRMRMGAHDLKQLGAGAVLAIAITLSVFWYLL
jgi:hypothetical protein